MATFLRGLGFTVTGFAVALAFAELLGFSPFSSRVSSAPTAPPERPFAAPEASVTAPIPPRLFQRPAEDAAAPVRSSLDLLRSASAVARPTADAASARFEGAAAAPQSAAAPQPRRLAAPDAEALRSVGAPVEGESARAFGALDGAMAGIAARVAGRYPRVFGALLNNRFMLDGFFGGDDMKEACSDFGAFKGKLSKNGGTNGVVLQALLNNPESLRVFAGSEFMDRASRCPSVRALASDPSKAVQIVAESPVYLQVLAHPNFALMAGTALPESKAAAEAVLRLPAR